MTLPNAEWPHNRPITWSDVERIQLDAYRDRERERAARTTTYTATTRRWSPGTVDVEVWPGNNGYRAWMASRFEPTVRSPVPVAVVLLAEGDWQVDGDWWQDGERWRAAVTRPTHHAVIRHDPATGTVDVSIYRRGQAMPTQQSCGTAATEGAVLARAEALLRMTRWETRGPVVRDGAGWRVAVRPEPDEEAASR